MAHPYDSYLLPRMCCPRFHSDLLSPVLLGHFYRLICILAVNSSALKPTVFLRRLQATPVLINLCDGGHTDQHVGWSRGGHKGWGNTKSTGGNSKGFGPNAKRKQRTLQTLGQGSSSKRKKTPVRKPTTDRSWSFLLGESSSIAIRYSDLLQAHDVNDRLILLGRSSKASSNLVRP